MLLAGEDRLETIHEISTAFVIIAPRSSGVDIKFLISPWNLLPYVFLWLREISTSLHSVEISCLRVFSKAFSCAGRQVLLLNPSQPAPAGVNLTGFTPCGRRLSTVALSSSSRRRTNYQSHFSLKSRLRPAAICTQIAFRNGTEMGRFVLEPAWVLG